MAGTEGKPFFLSKLYNSLLLKAGKFPTKIACLTGNGKDILLCCF